MPNKILRCAIYIRVSTAEQLMHGKSLQAQNDYLASYANDHGMTVVGVYADEGKTARNGVNTLGRDMVKKPRIYAVENLFCFWHFAQRTFVRFVLFRKR